MLLFFLQCWFYNKRRKDKHGKSKVDIMLLLNVPYYRIQHIKFKLRPVVVVVDCAIFKINLIIDQDFCILGTFYKIFTSFMTSSVQKVALSRIESAKYNSHYLLIYNRTSSNTPKHPEICSGL